MTATLDPYIGSMAGIATSVLWTATSLFFTAAGKRIGPTAVNVSRILLAIALHATTFRLLTGVWIPHALGGQVLYLALSGVIGLSIGDQALLVAFVDVGPRLTLLIMTTSPLFAAFLGWVVLGEALALTAWVGILLTIGGVAWVVLERSQTGPSHTSFRARGIVLAFIGSACQAGGLLLSKQGMGHGWLPEDQHLDPQAATLVRMLFAGVGMIPIVALYARREQKRRKAGVLAARSGSLRSGLIFAACGCLVGPYLGVWMSLVAGDRAPLGIAQALCSLAPVFILPIIVIFYRDRVSPRAAIGAVIAVAGSILLFIQPG